MLSVPPGTQSDIGFEISNGLVDELKELPNRLGEVSNACNELLNESWSKECSEALLSKALIRFSSMIQAREPMIMGFVSNTERSSSSWCLRLKFARARF